MPSYNLSTRGRIADINSGLRVYKASASCGATADVGLFNVLVGNVMLLGLVGIWDGTAETAATTIAVKHDPTTGTETIIGAASGTQSAKELGSMLTLNGTALGAMVDSTGVGASPIGAAGPILIQGPGIIEMTVAGATNTQEISWYLWYVPLTDGASVEAV
jgi:hypothetical protein